MFSCERGRSFHQDFSGLVVRSIQYCLEQPPSQSAGQKDTRESRRGGLPEPNDSCSCTIVYGGVWRAELPHTVFVKSSDVTHRRKQWLSLSVHFLHSEHSIQSIIFPQSHTQQYLSFGLFAPRFPFLDLVCQGYFPPNTSGVFISQSS